MLEETSFAFQRRGEAEPARVGVRFDVAGDGRIERARVAEVTEYCRAPARRSGALGPGAVEPREGELDGELARCLLRLTERVRVDAPPALLPAEASFVFRPELADSYPPAREAAGPCTQ